MLSLQFSLYLVVCMDGSITVHKVIMFVVDGGHTLKKVNVAFINLYIGACDNGVVVDMLAVLCRISGHKMIVVSKIGIFGRSTGEFMIMSEYLGCFAFESMCMKFMVHEIHPLLTDYA